MTNNPTTRQILANVGALVSGSGFARVFSALTMMIIARQLGPDAFGQYASSLSVISLASVLFSLGLDGWLLRNGGDDRESIGRAAVICLVIKGGLGLLWLVGVLLLAPLLRQDAFPLLLVYLSGLVFWFEELTHTVLSAFKAALHNKVTLWLLTGSQLLLLLLTLGLSWLGVGAAEYLAGRVAAAALSFLAGVVLLLRYFGRPSGRPLLRRVLRQTMPFAVSIALATIYAQADVTIVASILGKTASGLYAPAITLARTLFLVPASLYGVLLPLLSQSYRRDPAAVPAQARQFLLWSGLLGLAMAAGTALLAHPVVRLLYGAQYSDSGDILFILSGVLLFRCLSSGLAAVLVAVGWQKKRVVIQAIAALFNVLVNILIARAWGIGGVAVIYVLTELILVMGLWLLWVRWLRRG